MTIKEQFLSMLRGCPGYPFDETLDSLLFDIAVQDFPGINILRQTEKKVDWWEKNPRTLMFNPRKQLYEWLKKEFEFQKNGGPQRLGDIIEFEDSDHRRFVADAFGFLRSAKK